MDFSILRWRFEQAYPGMFRDGEIGWFEFWDGVRCLGAIEARWRLNQAVAANYGLNGGEEAKDWARTQEDLAAGLEE